MSEKTLFCSGGTSPFPTWSNSTSEKPQLLGNCHCVGNSSGTYKVLALNWLSFIQVLIQAVWNNWCALMVISLTKISLDGKRSLHFCFLLVYFELSLCNTTPNHLSRSILDWEMGLPPWSPSSACVHHHCYWGWHCHRPDKVWLALLPYKLYCVF